MIKVEPLASKIRPEKITDFVGQKHLVLHSKPISTAIKNKHLISMILWGPPGVGKTTLARIYAKSLGAEYFEISAVSAGKADVRKIIESSYETDLQTILFLDEIHRFNKAQQDFLLPYVEKGVIFLIGATTENPSFEVIAPLLSRCRVFTLNELSSEEIMEIIDRALEELNRKDKVDMDIEAKEWLVEMANGDARQAITMIENTHSLYKKLTIKTLKETLQSKLLRYDKKGEEHYNTISAYIKSMRAGDENAAIYYLARMIEAGEDPLYIARRMVIFASEDIGLASPSALIVANEVFSACEKIGYPECAINLAHGTAFLAKSKKNRSSYNALRSAQKDISKYGNLPIPLKLRNAVTKLNTAMGYDY
ncbi:replication-associated recombination protein A [Patescibacteria group bacterium]